MVFPLATRDENRHCIDITLRTNAGKKATSLLGQVLLEVEEFKIVNSNCGHINNCDSQIFASTQCDNGDRDPNAAIVSNNTCQTRHLLKILLVVETKTYRAGE